MFYDDVIINMFMMFYDDDVTMMFPKRLSKIFGTCMGENFGTDCIALCIFSLHCLLTLPLSASLFLCCLCYFCAMEGGIFPDEWGQEIRKNFPFKLAKTLVILLNTGFTTEALHCQVSPHHLIFLTSRPAGGFRGEVAGYA